MQTKFGRIDLNLLAGWAESIKEAVEASKDLQLLRIAGEMRYVVDGHDDVIAAQKERENVSLFLQLLRENGFSVSDYARIVHSMKKYLRHLDVITTNDFVNNLTSWAATPEGQELKRPGFEVDKDRERFMRLLQDNGYNMSNLDLILDSMNKFMGVLPGAVPKWNEYNNHLDAWHQTTPAIVLRNKGGFK
jgi:hypothetical protein